MVLHEQKFELIQEARKGGSGAREMPLGNPFYTYEASHVGKVVSR